MVRRPTEPTSAKLLGDPSLLLITSRHVRFSSHFRVMDTHTGSDALLIENSVISQHLHRTYYAWSWLKVEKETALMKRVRVSVRESFSSPFLPPSPIITVIEFERSHFLSPIDTEGGREGRRPWNLGGHWKRRCHFHHRMAQSHTRHTQCCLSPKPQNTDRR